MIAFYIVTGERYEREARLSAESFTRHAREGDLCQVYTNEDFGVSPLDWFVASITCLNRALERLDRDHPAANLLWLDSDTYVCAPVCDDFDAMLERFDLVFAHAPGHRTAETMQKIPDCFPEVNIGVIAMRNNHLVRRLWQQVAEAQQLFSVTYRGNDQAPLRDVLWAADPVLRFYVMPAEYNCRFNFGCQVRDRVRILHGRTAQATAESYEQTARSLNAGYVDGVQLPPRLWSPATAPGREYTRIGGLG